MQWIRDHWWLFALLALFALGAARGVYCWVKCRWRGAPAQFQEILELVLLRCPLQPTIEAYLRMRAQGSSVTLSDVKRAFAVDPVNYLKLVQTMTEQRTESEETTQE
jgi:hypothetical protein